MSGSVHLLEPDIEAGVPDIRDDDEPDVPFRPRMFKPSDVLVMVGSAVSALCLTWVVYYRLTPLEGALGYWACAYLAFLVIYWLVIRDRQGSLAAKDRLAAVAVSTTAALLLTGLLLILGYTLYRGYHALRPSFFTQDQQRVGALSKSTAGGGEHAIIGTLEQVALAVAISVPLGVITAVFLNEIGGRLARPVRIIVDSMSSIPSILAGLFIYAIWVLKPLHEGQSGLAAALALSVLMLPTVARTCEVVLRLVPGGLREASLALGSSEWRAAWRVVLPTAKAGLFTAVILGIARAVGETAPVLLTAGGSFRVQPNPLAGRQDSLPLFVYRYIGFAQKSEVDRAWTGALVLIGLVLVLFIIARILGSRGPGRQSRPARKRQLAKEVT